VSRQELETIRGEIVTAEAKLQKAQDRLNRIQIVRKRMNEALAAQKDVRTPSDIVAELDLDDRQEAALDLIPQQKFALEQAKNRQEVFEKHTRPKTIRERNSEIEKAKSNELARRQAWELEKDKGAGLEKQIKNCTLPAPDDGPIVYANDPN